MSVLRVAAFGSLAAAAVLLAIACGNDEDFVVRPRLDAGAPDAPAGDADTACGVPVPATYESPAYATNAAVELAARSAFDAFVKPMKDVESALASDAGAPDAGPSQAQLAALYAAGSPSLRTLTTDFFQGKVDAWLQDYEPAVTAGAWAPFDPPPAKGGTYGTYVVTPRGVDVRQAVEKGLYNAAFYNHAAKLVATGPLTEATVDRLVASFGASPAFANDPNAASNADVLAAAYAARRDAKDAANPGPYLRAKRALLVAKAAIGAGDKCNGDRDAALRVFFREWERSQYASAIFFLSDIKARLAKTPLDGPAMLHAHASAIGFIAGFRTIDPTHRKISDEQIDALLAKAYVPNGAPAEAFKVLTAADAAAKLDGVITDIKGIYAFTDAEMQAFEKNN